LTANSLHQFKLQETSTGRADGAAALKPIGKQLDPIVPLCGASNVIASLQPDDNALATISVRVTACQPGDTVSTIPGKRTKRSIARGRRLSTV
jgi:hypothetical protein